MKKALYAGSFDPFTNGHEDVLLRARELFDEVILLVAVSPHKQPIFTVEQRITMLQQQYGQYKNVKVDHWTGLLVDYAKNHDVNFMVRGIRSMADFDIEFQMAAMNHKLNKAIETVFLPARGEHAHLSSSLVREVFQHGGDISRLVPDKILKQMQLQKNKQS